MNYQIKLDEIIKNIGETKPKLLLHSCCAPCSSYVLTYLAPFFEITVLYYNPNINPFEEYLKRKEEQIKLINILNLNIHIMDCDYEEKVFFDKIKGFEKEVEGGQRCFLCYELRLDKTAQLASQNHFDYFGTTLTVSPYKNALKLNELGSIAEQKYGIKYLYSDFKKNEGYKTSIKLSNQYDLYRQNYCGCIYSKNN